MLKTKDRRIVIPFLKPTSHPLSPISFSPATTQQGTSQGSRHHQALPDLGAERTTQSRSPQRTVQTHRLASWYVRDRGYVKTDYEQDALVSGRKGCQFDVRQMSRSIERRHHSLAPQPRHSSLQRRVLMHCCTQVEIVRAQVGRVLLCYELITERTSEPHA